MDNILFIRSERMSFFPVIFVNRFVAEIWRCSHKTFELRVSALDKVQAKDIWYISLLISVYNRTPNKSAKLQATAM